MENYPGNSNTRPAKEQAPEAKQVEKTVTSQVVRRKKGIGKRFSEAFINGDAQTAGQTVLWDTVVPSMKDLLWKVICEGSEGIIYGPLGGSRRSSSGRHVTVEGPGYRYDKVGSSPVRDPRPQLSRVAKRNFDFDELVIETRVEAEETLTRLYDLLERYKEVSVHDFYQMLDIRSEPTDHKYGWTNLRSSSVVRARGGGYILDLPRPEPLD